jgi:tellurite resistance-related uncharacterized protein
MAFLPSGLHHVRTTPWFDRDTVPAGLLAAHQVAEGVWGRLIVDTGSLAFTFEDEPDRTHRVEAGGDLVIPPATPHHVTVDGPVRFAVEFYRVPETP